MQENVIREKIKPENTGRVNTGTKDIVPANTGSVNMAPEIAPSVIASPEIVKREHSCGSVSGDLGRDAYVG